MPVATAPPYPRPPQLKPRLYAWPVKKGGSPPAIGVSVVGLEPVIDQVKGAVTTLPVECQSMTQSWALAAMGQRGLHR